MYTPEKLITIKPTVRLNQNGFVKSMKKSYTFYLKSRIDDNLKPVITQITSSNNKLSIGEDFTLNIEAEDYDGIVKLVEINWNDGNSIYSKETNNQKISISAKHSFNKYGTYTWTATAYDNFVTKDTHSWKRKI